MNASERAAPVTDAQEKLDLFAIYLSVGGLHHIPFEEALEDPSIRLCLRNVLHAKRDRLARLKAKAANDAAHFELT